jgi:hypothetical protein
VDVGDDGYLERKVLGPLRRLNVIADDTKPQYGLAKPVGRGRRAEGAEPGEEAKKSRREIMNGGS